MELENIKAVIGTNSWGSSAYEKVLRGDYVGEMALKELVDAAAEKGFYVLDTAQDYGFGLGQKIIGNIKREDTVISAKYTPMGAYKQDQVRKSLEKDLQDIGRDYVDIYWLHLPSSVEENLAEMIALYKEGKIRNVGISNFNLEETQAAKKILEETGVPLYGVQNHFSVLSRGWDRQGLISWCRENCIAFWGWATLEEGVLTGKQKSKGALEFFFGGKRKKLKLLFDVMESIGGKYGLDTAGTAIAYSCAKGVIPIVGCRKTSRIDPLFKAVNAKLTEEDILALEKAADETRTTVLGDDTFRFAVKK